MASPIPASLKAADISRFALRAAQLEKVKPVVAYYCKYWMVNQILSKGLHTANEEATAFTTTLMDQLEQVKTELGDNDAITDDLAGKAYVEQFALETFQRADNAVRANKASRQTADTFQASATFLELMQIWGPPEPEIAAKTKFAKFHALRIAKAIKAGEDPNLSNPKQEEPELIEPPLEPDDPDLLSLNGQPPKARQPSAVEVPDEADHMARNLAQRSVLDESLHPSRASSVPRPPPPTVENAPDEADHAQRSFAQRSLVDESLHPSRAPSVGRPLHTDMTSPPANTSKDPVSPLPGGGEDFYTNQPSTTEHPDVSPIGPSPQSATNYFPQVPSPVSQAPPPAVPLELPSAPSDFEPPPPTPSQQPTQPLPPPPAPSEADVSSHAFSPSGPIPPPSIPPISQAPHQPPPPLQSQDRLPSTSQFTPSHGPPAQQMPLSHLPPNQPPQYPPPPRQPQYPPQQQHPTYPPQAQPQPPSQPPPLTTATGTVDEESMLAAQKHARWAISALNFEDVPTAVKELRGALRSLGAG